MSSSQTAAGGNLFYHVVDSWFGVMGSNNSYLYTQKEGIINGPPHSFPMIFGSNEPAPIRRSNWLYQDTQFVLISAVIIFIVRRLVIEKIVAHLFGLNKKSNDKKDEKEAAAKAHRVQENTWFSLYYTISSIAGFLILQQTPWLFDLNHLIIGYPEQHTGFEYPLMREYLLVGAGFYVQALFTLIFVDEKMKDFWEMLVHHLVTIGLIYGCISVYYHRIGTLVLILHDVVDIFLYCAKASKHMKARESTTTALFVLFVLAFLLLRLIYFPSLILKSLTNYAGWDYPSRYYLVRYVSDSVTPIEVSDYGICLQRYCLSPYWALIALMAMLVCLHIFWFSLISKIVWRKLVGRGLDDIREDDVDDSDDEDDKKKKKKD
ncbi:predicted protein [Naegleria gruberi]|uniref:Predicted protein n=1 Tax=Naegleria gruberi TaxID=5762 RepID=D2W475_NAEGR|nr:uncharacterized protein NAEGRDRAFT_76204 [Naegleria gruberi]EFC36131.1 predicted protein [Naegleria gruberi]|eukprot:XP_002668875.1 predicted protein [Naegleria gruberi strain NEG-M]